jgi:16S rRNA (cytosine1402-N4)-methyltransferase
VEVVKAAIPASARRTGGHPARRTFQALRIEVNRELEQLERGLRSAIAWLAPGGRIAVISYHSLEDGIVRDVFRDSAQGCICPPDLPVCRCGREPVVRIVTKRPITPSAEEIDRNPRSRSAKLRVAEKR